VAVTPDETGALRDAALAYRQGVESQLKVVHAALSQTRTEAEGLRAKLAELATDVGTERQRVTTTISEFQSQFSAAQEARNKEHTEGQGKRQEAFATLLSEAQAQFATAQDSRNKDHAESQAKRQEVFAALEGDYQKRLAEQNAAFEANRVSTSQAYQSHIDGLKAEYAASAKGILDAMEKQKADVEKLVGVIGNLGVTSGYLKTANAARTQTWIWQGATVASLLSMIGFAYKAFLPVLDHATSSVLGNGQALQSASPGMSWLGFATRVLLTITVGVLAAYARSQADKNQEIERRNRKMALELEAMGPYLAPLPLEKQHEFRLSMGDRSFGKDDTVPSGATPSPATLLDVGSTYIDKVTELLKAAKK